MKCSSAIWQIISLFSSTSIQWKIVVVTTDDDDHCCVNRIKLVQLLHQVFEMKSSKQQTTIFLLTEKSISEVSNIQTTFNSMLKDFLFYANRLSTSSPVFCWFKCLQFIFMPVSGRFSSGDLLSLLLIDTHISIPSACWVFLSPRCWLSSTTSIYSIFDGKTYNWNDSLADGPYN